jgi:fructose-1,6-bisphosphatase I
MERLTLVEHIIKSQAQVPHATGELSRILARLSLAGRMIATEIMRAGFVGKLGYSGETNVQGEQVRTLDQIANQTLVRVFNTMDLVSSVASEEMEHAHSYAWDEVSGKYVLFFDPLDGSSNVDVNGSMGSIFSVLRRRKTPGKVTNEDLLQPGRDQVVAGYILYGPSTMFVYTAGATVSGFTLDRSVGEFFMTHPNIKIPESKGSYSVNESNQSRWPEAVRRAVEAFRTQRTACGPRSSRYVGALVADFHRLLVQGGIYMYPGELKRPDGKLRLMYEANPLAMIVEVAGGAASDGRSRILDIMPADVHQRCPLFIGSKGDVDEVLKFLQ